ncbi:MAG: nitroreductase family protein [Succinatimonas sp.]|nr:nitroreductase family protein [Succinatimonas sp.]
MDFQNLLLNRYATKRYDKNAVIDDKIIDNILQCAVLTPSALNLQPWAFFLIKGQAQKEKFAGAIKDFNLQRYLDAYVAIVITSKATLTKDDVMEVCLQEQKDGRFENEEVFKQRYEHILRSVDAHNKNGTMGTWCAKQTYIALATILYAAKSNGIDCTPLEGIDRIVADDILNLRAQNLRTQSVVLLGKAALDDSNSLKFRPKSRFNTIKTPIFK